MFFYSGWMILYLLNSGGCSRTSDDVAASTWYCSII